MSHMQSVPGPVEQDALAEEQERVGRFRPEKGRKKIATGEGRLAFFLVAPTVALLALIVGYPIIKAIIASFQKDPGLNPATGFFNKGGQFAGFANYKTWLLQQCPTPGGGTVKCPPGTLASEFWGVGRSHARVHYCRGDLGDRHRHDHGADDAQGVQGPRPGPRRDPRAVGDPDRGLGQIVAGHLRPGGVINKILGHNIQWSEKWPARIAIVLDRHLEDDAVHGPAHPGRAAGHSE